MPQLHVLLGKLPDRHHRPFNCQGLNNGIHPHPLYAAIRQPSVNPCVDHRRVFIDRAIHFIDNAVDRTFEVGIIFKAKGGKLF